MGTSVEELWDPSGITMLPTHIDTDTRTESVLISSKKWETWLKPVYCVLLRTTEPSTPILMINIQERRNTEHQVISGCWCFHHQVLWPSVFSFHTHTHGHIHLNQLQPVCSHGWWGPNKNPVWWQKNRTDRLTDTWSLLHNQAGSERDLVCPWDVSTGHTSSDSACCCTAAGSDWFPPELQPLLNQSETVLRIKSSDCLSKLWDTIHFRLWGAFFSGFRDKTITWTVRSSFDDSTVSLPALTHSHVHTDKQHRSDNKLDQDQ